MGERDAFGREKNEDTLADMGWRGGVGAGDPLDAGEVQRPFAKPKPVQPPPLEARAAVDPIAPVPPPSPARPAPVSVSGQEQLQAMVTALSTRRDQLADAPAARPRAPRPRAPRRGGPSIAKLLISLCLLAIVGIGAIKAVGAGRDAVGDIKDKINDTVQSGQAAVTPPTATPGAKPSGSYLTDKNLKAALAAMPAGRLVSPLRVDNKSVDAQVVHGSASHVVVLRTDGTKFDTKVPLTGPHQKTLHVNAAAPARIVKALHRKPSQVNYMVLLDDHWVVFLKNGRHYQASTAGTHVTKIG